MIRPYRLVLVSLVLAAGAYAYRSLADPVCMQADPTHVDRQAPELDLTRTTIKVSNAPAEREPPPMPREIANLLRDNLNRLD